ncbi:hypothetical protein HanPSC8_Chr11g0454261 [Helianthus annuus]|nr:hypothetical protein HanPSC8_Chr11g0454261 [Helianthus annuus]
MYNAKAKRVCDAPYRVEERRGIKPSKGNRSARLRVEERRGIKPSKGNRSARLR